MTTLDNWSVTTLDNDPFKAPEQKVYRLQGEVYNHPRFNNGDWVVTSAVVDKLGTLIITKSGSKYNLGKVDLRYEKEYPNARERVFKSLIERRTNVTNRN